jgi:hypothetical protein
MKDNATELCYILVNIKLKHKVPRITKYGVVNRALEVVKIRSICSTAIVTIGPTHAPPEISILPNFRTGYPANHHLVMSGCENARHLRICSVQYRGY